MGWSGSVLGWEKKDEAESRAPPNPMRIRRLRIEEGRESGLCAQQRGWRFGEEMVAVRNWGYEKDAIAAD